jgi:AcrR family transcriptional regulator
MAPSKARAAETRGRILDAAERLFAEQGFDRVSMPAIAEAAGITAGAIYRHFASKADLFFEVVRGAVAGTPVTPDEGPGGAEGVPDIVSVYTTPRLKRVRQLAVEVHAAATRDPRVGQLLRASLERQIGDLGAGIAARQVAGSLDPALDSGFAANLALVVIMGLMHAETLTPALIGNAAWRAFVADRVAVMLGARA